MFRIVKKQSAFENETIQKEQNVVHRLASHEPCHARGMNPNWISLPHPKNLVGSKPVQFGIPWTGGRMEEILFASLPFPVLLSPTWVPNSHVLERSNQAVQYLPMLENFFCIFRQITTIIHFFAILGWRLFLDSRPPVQTQLRVCTILVGNMATFLISLVATEAQKRVFKRTEVHLPPSLSRFYKRTI